MRRLPYLNGVRAFEAVARHGSFAKAATELNVTPAAISRMVRLLEERLGVALFERRPNRLVPTQAGHAYHVGLSPILDALALLTEQVQGQSSERVLTVGVGPTFAIRWLIPRLAAFRTIAPDVDVRVTTGGAAAPFAADWTCGIKLGSGKWDGLQAEPLFEADLIPVCSPQLAKSIRTLKSLAKFELLRVAHAEDDWPRWLAAAGIESVSAGGPTFEFYGHALQAAADGLGVAVGITPYIDDDLRAGRLIAPFPLAVPKASRWWLIYDHARKEEPAFRTFRDWLLGEAQQKVSAD